MCLITPPFLRQICDGTGLVRPAVLEIRGLGHTYLDVRHFIGAWEHILKRLGRGGSKEYKFLHKG